MDILGRFPCQSDLLGADQTDGASFIAHQAAFGAFWQRLSDGTHPVRTACTPKRHGINRLDVCNCSSGVRSRIVDRLALWVADQLADLSSEQLQGGI